VEEDGQVRIVYREPEGAAKSLRVDRVIHSTGSETDCRRIDDSLITSLFVQGLARPDGLFLGLDVDDHGALLDYQGNASQTLFAIGPTRKGRNWETTAVPEIRQQAAALATHLARVVESGYDRATSFFDTAV
jgi:uncharacterized NAD(P)/FAD-binding protein YdhS